MQTILKKAKKFLSKSQVKRKKWQRIWVVENAINAGVQDAGVKAQYIVELMLQSC